MTSSSLSPAPTDSQSVVVGVEVERLLAVNQDGESDMEADVPEADEGFFLDEKANDKGEDAKVNAPDVSEEKSKEAHEVNSKRSPCKPNSTEVAKHYKTHLPYRSWCPVCVRAKGRRMPIPAGRKGKTRQQGSR